MAPQITDIPLRSTAASMPEYLQDPLLDGRTFETDSPDSNVLEPIAIIGFAFRFPNATDSTALWQMMLESRCAVKETPRERMNVDAWYHPDSSRRGQFYSRNAHYLEEDISLFDAPFFSLSADEAAGMDPQQRLLLEVTYTALETAGIPMEKATGTRTSVHVGCFGNDYLHVMCRDPEMTADYDVLGANVSMNANRLSWFFDFRGPSMNIDTACSSSLVALDMACKELLAGNTDMGVVTGCNLILAPEIMLLLSNVNMLSPDGRSYSFDHRANGYGRGEGIGTLIIKRLSDAVHDGDVIRAVIRSTGSNQDGLTSSGIMQPNGDSQAALILDTYQKAGLSLRPTRFFEAHGTGTPVGDPIELNAVGSVFRKVRSADDPLIVGALKSNIGHLEGASGIASVIKAILVLERGWIPPNANFEKLNHSIDLDFLNIKLPHEPIPWPTQGLRRASVNSFGFGGTNSHVILDDAFHYLKQHAMVGNTETVERPPSSPLLAIIDGELHRRSLSVLQGGNKSGLPSLLTLSANDKAGIKRLSTAYAAYFQSMEISHRPIPNFISDLAYTLNVRRSALRFKSFWIASDFSELQTVAEQATTVYQALDKPTIAFVFTGQGAQWLGMGCQLIQYSVFKQSIMKCDEYLRNLGCRWSLAETIWNEGLSSNINAPNISQPATTALQIALVDLLNVIGVHPAAVIGHSSGEIGAAYAYGALSAAEAIKIAYFRGVCAAHLAETQERRGAMIAVGLSEQETREYIQRVAELHGSCGTEVACINSQRNTTVSGDDIQIDALKHLLEDDGIFARKLLIPLAYHSSHMLQIASKYRDAIGDLAPVAKEQRCKDMISSVTGQKVCVTDLRTPDYWVQNLVSPVQFKKSFNQLCDDPKQTIRKKLDCSHRSHLGINIFLEIGPHAALQGPIRDLLEELRWGQDIKYYTLLRRGEHAMESFLKALGPLYCLGCSVDLEKLGRLSGQTKVRSLVNLPGYLFDHSKSYWRESQISKNFRLGQHGKLDLVGKPTTDSTSLESKWRNHIRVSEMPWVKDHMINDTVIYPAAGMLVMAIEALNQIAARHQSVVVGFELKDVTFSRALTVPNTADGVETTLSLYTSRNIKGSFTDVWSEFRVSSFENDSWQECCHGFIRTEYEAHYNEVDQELHGLADCIRQSHLISQACDQEFVSSQLYDRLYESGFHFGATFQTLCNGKYSRDHQAESMVKVFQWPTDQHPQPHIVHPTTLDGILHVTLSAMSRGGSQRIPTAIPTGIRKIWVAKNGLMSNDNEFIKAMASVNTVHNRGHDFSVYATDESQSRVLVKVDGLQSSIVAETEDIAGKSSMKHSCYHIVYHPDPDISEPTQLAEYCTRARVDTNRLDYFKELNFILFKFVHQTLHSVESLDLENVPPNIKRYVEWAKLQCEKFADGTLPLSRPEWTDLLHDGEYFQAACARIASASDQGQAFVHTGEHLPAILRGEIDPIEFLFKGEDMMVKFYAEINDRPCFDEWDSLLKTYAHKNPNMKILEIGAGTGGTSRLVFRTLCSGDDNKLYKSYDYTDVSSAFFDRAQQEFGKYGGINFQVLDIEQDAVAQGFEAHTYDLIIAANVLHVAANIRSTLQNIRTLLKPGGKLMMYEITKPDILRTGLVFGLLSGWWTGQEDGRLWNPGLRSEQWNEALRETGFSGLDLEFPDYKETECQEGGILIATAIEVNLEPDLEHVENIYFIIDPTSEQQLELYDRIKSEILPHFGANNPVIIESYSLESCVELQELADATLVFIQEMTNPLISDINSIGFYNIQKAVGSCNRILFVTAGGGQSPRVPEYSLLNGLARTLRNEKSSRYFVTLALDIAHQAVTGHQISYIFKVLTDVIIPSSKTEFYEPEFVEINGLLQIPRVRRNTDLSERLHQESVPFQSSITPLSQAGPLKLSIGTTGLLDTLHWREDREHLQPQPEDEIEIQVQSVGMNFKDCLIALGQVPGTTFGQECAGVVIRAGTTSGFCVGDRVVGFGSNMFKTRVRCKANFATRITDSMSFAQAASIPAQFCTAWQVVVEIGRLRAGESILIHAAAGGTGQAAIQIAQYIGAEIFATVGSKSKKQILMDEYHIPEDHIFYSRDTRFASGVLSRTKGRGVDLIVNSLAGDILRASWECIASYGRFVEIGKKDILSNSRLDMIHFGKNSSFAHFDGSIWIHERPDDAKRCLETVYRLFNEGKLRVQKPLQVLGIDEVEQAFRQMQSGTAAGKIVLEMRPEAQLHTILPKDLFTLDPQATYIIAGGLGGIGRTVARWMATRGAKHLVLLGRSGPKTEAAFALIHELEAEEVSVYAPPCDLIDSVSVQRVMQDISKNMPPIKGCIQGSMVLRDKMFHEMSHEEWHAAVECKGMGTWNLEINLPQNLDFFIMLSSVSGIVGLPGQANYASGNSYMDGFAKYRVANSQKAVSLDLGAMVDDGLLVETEGFLDRVLDYGTLDPVTRQQFLGMLDYYCHPEACIQTPETSQVIVGVSDRLGEGRMGEVLRNNRVFSHIQFRGIHNISGADENNTQVDFQKQLGTAHSLQEGRQIVYQAVLHKFTHSYRIIGPDTEVNPQVPLHTLGVDSLLAVEICNWIKREFSADVAVFEVLGGATLSSLDVLVASRSHVKHPKWG